MLKLGNNVKKVREILDCDNNLPDIDENIITELVFGNKKRKIDTITNFTSLTSITHNETDKEIKSFIKKLIWYLFYY